MDAPIDHRDLGDRLSVLIERDHVDRVIAGLPACGAQDAAHGSDVRIVPAIADHDVIIEAWLYTVKINAAVVLGQDPTRYLDELWALADRDRAAVAGTVMGVAAGMPLDSGWPAFAVELVDSVADFNLLGLLST